MKKLYFLLWLLCALCFIACSNFQLAGGDMGVVSLSIGDNLAREIRSAASLRSATGGSYTLTASIRGDYSDSQTVTVADGNYSGVTFTFEGVPVGKKIILDLTAKAGSNYIWYGNSGKHTVEQGENLLTIALGRVSGVLMWDSSSVKIAPYGNYEAGSSLFNASPSSIAWCFDNAGNIYWYVGEENAAYRSDIQSSDSTYQQNSQYYYSPPFHAFTHDATTDILYGIGDGGSVKYWSGTGSDPKDITSSDGSFHSGVDSLGFTVHDNIAYIANYTETQDGGADVPILGVVQFSSYKLEDSPDDGSKTATPIFTDKTFTLPESFGANSPTGQMIYHEGALYLLSRVSVDSMYRVEGADTALGQSDGLAENYSLGAVLKINPDTLALDTRFGANGYLGLASSKTSFSGITEMGGNVTNGTVVYNGPTSSNDASVFYGPQGFVAIMPKKLVIADAGFSMEQEGVKVNLTKKTRVITVDLETLAFETERVEDSYYQSEYPSSSTIGYSYIVITN